MQGNHSPIHHAAGSNSSGSVDTLLKLGAPSTSERLLFAFWLWSPRKVLKTASDCVSSDLLKSLQLLIMVSPLARGFVHYGVRAPCICLQQALTATPNQIIWSGICTHSRSYNSVLIIIFVRCASSPTSIIAHIPRTRGY
jgi:hypothetical protein